MLEGVLATRGRCIQAGRVGQYELKAAADFSDVHFHDFHVMLASGGGDKLHDCGAVITALMRVGQWSLGSMGSICYISLYDVGIPHPACNGTRHSGPFGMSDRGSTFRRVKAL